MDVAEFVRVHQRMCDNYDLCRGCPMDGMCDPCTDAVYKDPQGVVEIVEKWSKEHPVQTNADKFEEVFGLKIRSNLNFDKDGRAFVIESDNPWILKIAEKWLDAPYEAPKEDNE